MTKYSESTVIMADGVLEDGMDTPIMIFARGDDGGIIGVAVGPETRVNDQKPGYYLSHDHAVDAMKEFCRIALDRKDLDFVKERAPRCHTAVPRQQAMPGRRM